MAYEAKTNWQLDDTVTEQDMNRIEQGLKDAYENSLTSPPPEQVNLRYGLQVVDAKRTAPLENVCIKGRTLVNLLGRDGNCESLNPFTSSPPNIYQGTAALDSANKVYGNNSIKISIGNGYTLATMAKSNIPCEKNKFYVAIAEVKNGNATNGIRVVLSGQAYGPTVPYQTSTTTFVLSFSKFASGSSTSLQVDIGVSGSAGQYAYVDGIRLYEITQDEYNAIDSMTPEQIAAKWPYVDDMKNICSPYIIRYGENLLPPFTECSLNPLGIANSIINVTSLYSITLDTTKVPNGQEVVVQYQDIPLVPETTYTLVNPSTNGYMRCRFDYMDRSPSTRMVFAPNTSRAFTTPANIKSMALVAATNLIGYTDENDSDTYTFGEVICSYSNPVFVAGSWAKPFKPRNEDYLFFPNVHLASNVDGTIYDTSFQCDGKYWKQTRYKPRDVSGDLAWDLLSVGTGSKSLSTNGGVISDIFYGADNLGIGTFVKYDGTILRKYDHNAALAPDAGWIASNGSIRISVANADSGWGDSYTPSQDEIKAYFLGYKMYVAGGSADINYNGSGTKAWAYQTSKAHASLTCPTTSYAGYTPYKLQYQLATPTVEEIAVEGGITFHEGLNQVEVGNGMIVREKTSPNLYGPNNSYYFNDIAVGSQFKYRANIILNIYKNGLVDKSVLLMPGAHNANGYSKARISAANYDQRAAYSATYIALDQYALSCNVQSIQGEYAGNLMNVVDSLVSSQTDLSTRVSILEGMHAQNMKGQWISPTLVNGWLEYADGYDTVRYIKDGFGVVHLKGLLKNGTLGAVIFTLPPGYRPKATKIFMTISDTNGSALIGRVDITANGDVRHTLGGAGYFSLEGITFLAEQ
ncbi:hypothetical protein [Paenibacillus ehimensis]|nr:hypothetical protein [Paenibacillus ehimensis]